MASYSWGEPDNKLPIRVRVFVEAHGNDHWIDEIDGPFNSLEDANEKALASAADWYERGNG
ncbi:hypothetical protein D3C80_2141730 [compost metagenome]